MASRTWLIVAHDMYPEAITYLASCFWECHRTVPGAPRQNDAITIVYEAAGRSHTAAFAMRPGNQRPE